MAGTPMVTNYKEYYASSLADSIAYQDFLCRELHSRGIVLQNIQSKRHQLKGENLFGLEIKLDKKYEQYGNLYIETAEKSHPDNPAYVVSGIHRNDNSWLYGIGDYREFFIFSKTFLKMVDRRRARLASGDDARMWPGRRGRAGRISGACRAETVRLVFFAWSQVSEAPPRARGEHMNFHHLNLGRRCRSRGKPRTREFRPEEIAVPDDARQTQGARQ